MVISAKVSSKVTVKAALKKKKLRPEIKKRTAVSLLRSINPTPVFRNGNAFLLFDPSGRQRRAN